MNDQTLTKYLKDIKDTAPLSRDEEQIVFNLYKETKNPLLKQKLVAANMKFVISVALRYKSCGVQMSDLISEGTVGLNRAVDLFDPSRGLKFITFAVWWIRRTIQVAINEHVHLIHIPLNKVAMADQAKKKAAAENRPLDEEAAQILGINQNQVSLDAKANDDAKNTYGDIIADPNGDIATTAEFEGIVNDLLKCLPEKERTALMLVNGVNCEKAFNLREAGEQMHCSHQRVKQLRDQAIRRIRKGNSKMMLETIRESVV